MSRSKDIFGTLRGLQLVVENSLKVQQTYIKDIWKFSSIADLNNLKDNQIIKENLSNVGDIIKDSADRISTVGLGVQKFASHCFTTSITKSTNLKTDYFSSQHQQENLKKSKSATNTKINSEFRIKLTAHDKALLEKLDKEHLEKLKKMDNKGNTTDNNPTKKESTEKVTITVSPHPKSKQMLSKNSKQRKVPSSRLSRMVSFGSLAAGLGIGTAAEYVRRNLGFGDGPKDPTNLFLTPANLDRIVDTLCKVRGAALKLGQIISIQDDNMVSPQLVRAFERVRKSADFMPNWQVEQVLISELSSNWRQKFKEFDEKPFAAASIGQVHLGRLMNDKEVAIKIQYPGVAKGIESDIDNLGSIMKLWDIFPKGMFLDNLMKVAKRELAWEVDYKREAECTKKFKNLLSDYPDYYVPNVIDDLSTNQVFTTEYLNGVPIDQCFDMDLEHRQFIGEKIMELCLLELLKFRFMQTDPNWANFLYDPENRKILLLDFGASREYSQDFMNRYVRILKAACDNDRLTVLNVSRELGFLTGYESKLMEEAHIDAVMILGEVFRCPDRYDFSAQDMTQRIQNLVPTMVSERLCPPPEEVYSLHRKLSGVFMLCSKLKISISCKKKFLTLYNEYNETV